ncbi:hypothetical protein EDD86DRAFT_182588, partial [Gorgonomyces haynaldii]
QQPSTQPATQTQHGQQHGQQPEPIVIVEIDPKETATKYRLNAQECSQKRIELIEQSKKSYETGDKQLAHEQSLKAKEEQKKMNEWNDKASKLFMEINNKNRPLSELDLHGQFVQEALDMTRDRIQACKQQKMNLCLITGKGLHSKDGPKIKPKVKELLDELQLKYEMNTPNEGCITV